MADGSPNIFAQFDPDVSGPAPALLEPQSQPAQGLEPSKPAPDHENIFAQFDPDLQPKEPSTAEAVGFHAAMSAIPAAGSLAAAGYGAGLGFAVGNVPGAIIGGFLGGFGGGWLTGKAQDAAITALPQDWQDSLAKEQALTEKYHPTASFLGGLLPYVLTMKPGGFTAAALPETATTLQRIFASPLTSHLFGSAVMGGSELGQEAVAGQAPDWTKIGIATGLGLVFNKPNRIGEAIMGDAAAAGGRLGVRAIEAAPVLGRFAPAPLPPPPPTIAEASDLGIIGEGVTAGVFHGSVERSFDAAMQAHAAAQVEQSIIGERARAADVYERARRLDPETMNAYDAASAQRDSFRARIQALENPTDDQVNDAWEYRGTLQDRLDEHIASQGGYTGGRQARQLRAQLREAQAEIEDLHARQDAYAKGQGVDTPEMTALRQQLAAADLTMRDLAVRRSAALRRAADAGGAHVVEPEGQGQYVIDRSHDVPYGGGSSVNGKTVYIDKDMPASLDVRVIGGEATKPMDPAKFIAIHEDVERQHMKLGEPYETAHRHALTAERAAVEASGYDFTDYQRKVLAAVEAIEHKGTDPNIKPPQDLITKPYPHKEAEFLKRAAAKETPEPSAKFEGGLSYRRADGEVFKAKPGETQKALLDRLVEEGKIVEEEAEVAQPNDFIRTAAAPSGVPPVVAPQPAPAAPINIAEDVARKVEAAGRPPEEAAMAGALWAANYRALADWFRGQRGTAEDLYREEGADIQGRGAAKPTEVPATEFAQTARPGPNSPGVGVDEGNRLGFAPELRVKVTTPPALPEKPLLVQTTTNGNAPQQIANVATILNRFKNAAASVRDWARMSAYAYASDEVPVPPYAFIRDINSAGAADKIRSLSPGQIADATHGFEQAAKMRAAYESGKLSPVTTGKLFLWSFLSRGVSPYVQESLFIDAFPGAGEWIEKAARGDFTEADLPAYREWSSSVAPKGSGQPGAGATHNLNAFGESFLLKMARQNEDGISHLKRLHDMMSDPDMTGQEIRREFLRFGEGVGIDNKVVSFTLLVAGHHDVMVIDRVQTRQLWDDGRFSDINIYDGQKNDEGKVITGTALANLTYGARGLLVYEAVERALADKIHDIYAAAGRPQDASIGRYHWESWVAYSQQEASHGTLGAILEDAVAARSRRNAPAIAEVQAKQGEYGAYEYGARYGRDVDGTPYFRYTIPGGNTYEFSVPAFREFLADIKKPANGVVPTGFKVTESGNAPWFQRTEVDRQALDRRAAYWADRGTEGDGARAIPGSRIGQGLADGAGFAVDRREFQQRGLGIGGAEAAPEGQPGGDLGRSESVGGGGLDVRPVERASDFHAAIAASKANNPYGAAVTLYPVEDYAGMKMFMSPDGGAGIAVKGDDIVSVFRHPDDGKGVVGPLLRQAVANGGRRLDAFDTILPSLYAKQGFRVVARLPFDPQYAPEGWSRETFAAFNGGHPDVVFMVYDPAHASAEGGARVGSYDEGVAAQHQALASVAPEAREFSQRGRSVVEIDRDMDENIEELFRRSPDATPEEAWKFNPDLLARHDALNRERAAASERIVGAAANERAISTPEFKRWFGDSKVIDGEGKPAVVYHGTRFNVEAFRPGEAHVTMLFGATKVDRHGFFFADDPKFASSFAEQGDLRRVDVAPNVMPVHLSIQHPLDLSEGFVHEDDVKRLVEAGIDQRWARDFLGDPRTTWEAFDDEDGAYFVSALRKAGYDGVRMSEIAPETKQEQKVWVALDPIQIKSVANRGTFSPESPNILEQAKKGGFLPGEGGVRSLLTIMRKTADVTTIIHESFHHFINQLMRAAAHPLAPEQLKADAQTALKFAGVEKAEDLLETTPSGKAYSARAKQAHEKLANAGMQYLYEGVAPSPGLASVFQRFKQWMKQLYSAMLDMQGTVPEKEWAPLTEEMRHVYDRLFATEPQRTVIAEHPGGPTLADIHEVDAKHTEPHEAAPAMDRVVEETARREAEVPSDVRAAIERAYEAERYGAGPGAPAGQPGGEGGGSAEKPGALSGTGGATGANAGGGALAERPSAVGGRGGQAGAEGAPAPTGAEPGAGRAGGPQRPKPASPVAALAPEPADTIPRPVPKFTDKAGNIRLENLDTPEDINQALREIAEAHQDFTGDRRGPFTPGQVFDLARAMGKDGAEDLVDKWARGRAYNAEQVTALRMLFTEASKATGMAMQAAAASGLPEDLAVYAAARQRLIGIQRVVSGATAEAGRALAAFRNLKGVANFNDELAAQITGKTLFQLQMEAKLGGRFETPEQVAEFIDKNGQSRSLGRMIVEFWTNNLISGPATHLTYTIANKILALMQHGPETLAASAVGHLARGLGREGEVIPFGEARARLRGYRLAQAAAAQAALEGLRSGMTTRLPGEEMRPLIPFTDDQALTVAKSLSLDPVTWREVMGDLYSFTTGIRDGIRATAELVSAGGEAGAPPVGFSYSPLGQTPDIAIKGVPVIPVGSLSRVPGRFIAALHSFDRTANQRAILAGEAFRAATTDAEAAEKAGRPMTGNDFFQRVAHWQKNPTDEMMERSVGGATTLALMGKGGPFLQLFSRLTNTAIKLPVLGETPILKFIDPFVKIAGNVMNQAVLQRTPLGLLTPSLREDVMGMHGTIAQDTAIGRMLVGSAMAITFGTLAAEGYMSGSGPSDPKEAAVWRLAGNQPHSVRVGDMWYQVNRLGPWGMLGSIAADLYDVAHAASEGDMAKAAGVLQMAFTQNILDESFMRGPADLIKAVEDPGRYGEGYIKNMLSSFVPFSVGLAQMDRAMDPYQRDARTVLDGIKAKIPGMSESLYPRRDVWGEALPNTQGLIPGVLAIYEQRMSQDPVNLAMLRIGVYPAKLEKKILNIELTPEQYDDFQRLAGRIAKQRLDVIVRSAEFNGWPTYVQHDVMTEQIKQAREAGRQMVIMKYPQIARDATLAKQARLRGETLQ